jgi:ABC-type Mn2+/Zn2+ transport system ATPase subunit
MDSKNIVLNVNGIEVIYNHVILVLKGVSLQVPEGGIVAILGGNGAGKTTTLRAISNLLKASVARSPRAPSSCAASASRTCRPPTWSSAAWCR